MSFPRRHTRPEAFERHARRSGALRRAMAAVLAGGILGSCTDADVTGVGRELIAGGVVRTVEIVLPAEAFLLSDSTLAGFSRASGAVTLLTLDAAAGLEARGAFRFGAAPSEIEVATDSTTIVEDTLATLVGARLEVVLDSLSRAPGDSAMLVAAAIQEPWDPATATWENRVDSAFVTTPWSVPGGGAAAPVDSAPWIAGTDSVSFDVDSATAVAWTDTTDLGRGALLSTLTDGARLEVANAVLWLRFRPSVLPDTIVEVRSGAAGAGRTTLLDAPPPPGDVLLIGGAPAHRAFFRMAPGLDTLPIPCPEPGVECGLTLADADLTFAGLELTATPFSGLPALAHTTVLAARGVVPDPRFPLSRAPLGPSNGSTEVLADAAGGVGDPLITVPVTDFLNAFIEGDEDSGDRFAVASLAEGFRFGTIAVRRAGHPDGPRLRLILTVASPQEIR